MLLLGLVLLRLWLESAVLTAHKDGLLTCAGFRGELEGEFLSHNGLDQRNSLPF